MYDGQGGLPALADDAFYSAIFERTYPDRDSRALFVMDELNKSTPHHGQHVLAGLAASGLAPLIVTTNFDQLLEDALNGMLLEVDNTKRLVVFHPQSSDGTRFALATDRQLVLVKVHGDLGTVTLSNTEAELALHDPALRSMLQTQLCRYGLVVAGYSGRDAAVMQMLSEVLEKPHPFPSGLTWVRRPEDPLPATVADLLRRARAAGVEPVHEVVVGGFGELMSVLEPACGLTTPVRNRLKALRPRPVRTPAARVDGKVQKYPQVRFGAVEITSLPPAARRLKGATSSDLAAIRRALRADRVRATVGWAAGELAAFGSDEELQSTLRPLNVNVTDEIVPLRPGHDGTVDNGTVGLLAEALTQALARGTGLTTVLRGGHRPMVRVRTPRPGATKPPSSSSPTLKALQTAVGGPVTGALPGPDGATLPWAESVTIGLECVDGHWLMVFAPDIWVRPTFVSAQNPAPSRDAAAKLAAEFVRERTANRYNRQAGAILGAWLKLLVAGGGTARAFGTEPSAGVDAVFCLTNRPVISQQLAGSPIQITPGQVP
ncbi:SIR2 family protein [Amycolatopsis sp. K13G38]|uniref:SIR2 family protein n=1 Tax=Amycolatopsis acididurans TaxID=2724524 RepID=A0ABX1J122_9PSEU|nr:SIR2 family protein [Amycolatopsis acididurans]NKQ51967.1 SIR2 family protein [Amycolatopsis acididurans]